MTDQLSIIRELLSWTEYYAKDVLGYDEVSGAHLEVYKDRLYLYFRGIDSFQADEMGTYYSGLHRVDGEILPDLYNAVQKFPRRAKRELTITARRLSKLRNVEYKSEAAIEIMSALQDSINDAILKITDETNV